MQAIRVHQFGDPEVMKLEDVPDPQAGPGQVLVRLHAVGVNPADTYMRSGGYGGKVPFPYIPGTDGAGVVESVGDGVKVFKVGDRVYIYDATMGRLSGTYAQLAVCDEFQVHALPDNATFAQGAAIGIPYTTAYRALFHKARVAPGENVFIHGASGGVGIAAVQLAVSRGVRVIGTASNGRGQELVKQQGAQHVLDHHAPDYLDKLTVLTGNLGPDVILEMLANVNLSKDLTVIAPRGRIVIIGNRGTIEINPRLAMRSEIVILGMMVTLTPLREMAAIHAALVAGLANGSLKPVINQELPLKNASRAHELLMQPGAYGKIVLIP